MGVLAWVMMGLAVWHFTIWLPDRFWGGIVGAFCGALAGGVICGLVINGFSIPGNSHIQVASAADAIPGAVIGIAVMYFEGVRRERLARAAGGRPRNAARA